MCVNPVTFKWSRSIHLCRHTCPPHPTLRSVWPSPPCRHLPVCCTPAASGVSLHGPRSARRSPPPVNQHFELMAALMRYHERTHCGVISYIWQQLVCSNDVVAVRLKAGQSSRRAGLHILPERNGEQIDVKFRTDVHQYCVFFPLRLW